MSDPSIDFYNAAVDAIQAGRLDEALIAAENSLTENPKDAETWQLYVIVLNALGRTEDARKATEKLREFGLGEADDYLLQAAEAVTSGDLATAISHYESALESGGDRPEIHSGHALALMEAERPDDALAAARKAVSLAPDDARANYALGHILRLRDEKDEALSALTLAVSAEPDLMLAVYEQGMLLADKDRLEEAMENFTRYLKANPGDPGALQAVDSIRHRMRPETR
jgi:tetratricopeptide (TPR) repeat protein